MGLESASVRPSVCPFTLSNTNISETGWPIIIKYYLKHHWMGEGCIRFWAISDQNSGFHGNRLLHSFLIGSSSFLQVTRTDIRSQMSSKFGKIQIRTAEVAALERLEKSP